MIEEREREAISRRKAVSLLGLAGALGLALPPILLAVSDAGAQAVPPAFNQVDKPIPGEENATRRIPRRKRVNERRQYRRKHRAARPAVPEPPSEDKPK